jgi:hypothetical protein
MLLLTVGCVTAVMGLVLLLAPKIPWLPPSSGKPDYGVTGGHLPGDIHWRGKNTSLHFPLVTCIVVSLVLTIALNLVLLWSRR